MAGFRMKRWVLATAMAAGTVGLLVTRMASAERFQDSWGVNIHFIEPDIALLDLIQQAGFRWIRMDFVWSYVEKEKGKYNFEGYDRLVKELKRRNIKPLFILDYGNPLYDKGLPPHTEEGRKAFAQFAYEAVKHYGKDAPYWEIWNEPNIPQFWKPQPDPKTYAELAKLTAQRIKEANKKAVVVSGGTSGIDLKFLEAVFQEGLLSFVDVVAVHPYRQTPPETVNRELDQLRELIQRYVPGNKNIPIWSGEWGYSTSWRNITPEVQAKYLVRMFLNNYASGLPVSIWYDIKCDGPDPNEPEHNFGIVNHSDLSPRPAYNALRALHRLVGKGILFRQMELPKNLHGLQFRVSGKPVTVLWTEGGEAQFRLKLHSDNAEVYDLYGKPIKTLTPIDALITVQDSPIYITGSRVSVLQMEYHPALRTD